MKHIPQRPKKMCKNKPIRRPPLYTAFNRRKTLGKSGVSSPAKWELYGKQRRGVAENPDMSEAEP